MIESLRVRGKRTEPICQAGGRRPRSAGRRDLFVVGDTLTEDGRIGKVTDSQGLVAIRPVMHDRLTPLTEQCRCGRATGSAPIRAGPTPCRFRLVKQTHW